MASPDSNPWRKCFKTPGDLWGAACERDNTVDRGQIYHRWSLLWMRKRNNFSPPGLLPRWLNAGERDCPERGAKPGLIE